MIHPAPGTHKGRPVSMVKTISLATKMSRHSTCPLLPLFVTHHHHYSAGHVFGAPVRKRHVQNGLRHVSRKFTVSKRFYPPRFCWSSISLFPRLGSTSLDFFYPLPILSLYPPKANYRLFTLASSVLVLPIVSAVDSCLRHVHSLHSLSLEIEWVG